jgi:hypothetical protein
MCVYIEMEGEKPAPFTKIVKSAAPNEFNSRFDGCANRRRLFAHASA